MNAEIETPQREMTASAAAIQTLADALTAFGIVRRAVHATKTSAVASAPEAVPEALGPVAA